MNKMFENASTRFSLQEDDLTRYAVRGVRPMAVVHIEKTADLRRWLKECHQQKAVVNVWGTGGHQDIGGAMAGHDITLDTSAHHSVVDYDRENFTITVKSGMRLGELEKIVRRHRQFFPMNPPRGSDKTIGGLVAANEYGSLCHHFGTARDLVLGLKAVLADGRLVRFGGKTMKNVAGYDMCKLFIGSMGTLGVIDELTLKLFPLPKSFFRFEFSTQNLESLRHFLTQINRSNLPIWDVIVKDRSVRCTIPTLDMDVRQLREHITAWFGEPLHDVPFKSEGFTAVGDHFFLQNAACLKWIVPKSKVADVFGFVQNQKSAGLAYPGRGIVFTRLPELRDAQAALAFFEKCRAYARILNGRLNIYRADKAVVQKIDVWDTDPSGLEWTAALKKQYDPQGVFVSGRYVGGI